jgi:hypothetical protein
MTTILDVVTLALRQGRVIGVNASPTSSEAAAGLQAFQGMIDTMISTPTFGALVDVYEIYNYTAGEGERVISPTAITVTFPDTIDDESIGEDRPPYDLSIVETVLAGNRTVKLYDRTGWVTLTDLTLASDAPFAGRVYVMPAIPFGLSAYRRDNGNMPELRVVNMMAEQAPTAKQGVVLKSRKGLVESSTIGDGPIQGQFQQPGTFGGDTFTLSGGVFTAPPPLLGRSTAAGRCHSQPSGARSF